MDYPAESSESSYPKRRLKQKGRLKQPWVRDPLPGCELRTPEGGVENPRKACLASPGSSTASLP